MSRHQRSFQTFVHRALRFNEYEQFYYGMCVIDKHDRVEFMHGCFHGDQVLIENAAAVFDVEQFRHAFDQHTRIAMLEGNQLQGGVDGTKLHTPPPAVANITLGSVNFQVVTTSFSTLCAVASRKSSGLIAKRLSFGTLVVVFRYPHSLEDVFSVVEECCASIT